MYSSMVTVVHRNTAYVSFAKGLDFMSNILTKAVNDLIMEKEETLVGDRL